MVGFLIATVIIALLAYGGFYAYHLQQKRSMIKMGKEAVDKADELRDSLNQQSGIRQNEINQILDNGQNLNYDSVRQNLQNVLKK